KAMPQGRRATNIMFRLVTPPVPARVPPAKTQENPRKGTAMSNQMNREILFKSRPAGLPSAANFELVEKPVPTPGPGEVLVRNSYMSVDPYMRGRMTDRASYVDGFKIGEVL